MSYVPLKTVSTIDALCQMLENDIYSLQFAPGSRITENDLTTRYGVSRNTVREAIAYLLSNGLLIKVANKGVYVKELNIDDVRDIFTLRGLLEAQAVRSIVSSGIIPMDLINVAEEIETISEKTDWTAHVTLDINFHRQLVEAADSPRLMRLYESIVAEVKLCIYQSHSIIPLKQENASAHMQLLRAMEQENLDEALEILSHHMEQAIESYEVGFKIKEKAAQKKAEESGNEDLSGV